MAEEIKLFRTWTSPYALRVVWALKLKGVHFETIQEDLAKKSSLLLQYNPIHKKVPVLVHGDKVVLESQVILEYIDETWAGYKLFPEDPHERSIVRFLAKFGDDQVFPSVFEVFLKQGKELEEAMANAQNNLKYLEEYMGGRKFFGGDTVGFTDLVYGWLATVVSKLEDLTDIKILDINKFPSLLTWIQNFQEVETIKENQPHSDKMMEKFKDMRQRYLASR